jgi:hypothetical protein
MSLIVHNCTLPLTWDNYMSSKVHWCPPRFKKDICRSWVVHECSLRFTKNIYMSLAVHNCTLQFMWNTCRSLEVHRCPPRFTKATCRWWAIHKCSLRLTKDICVSLVVWNCTLQFIWNTYRSCCNPSLGLTTKARACKGAGQERSSTVASHAFGSVKECEGMSPHTPKRAPTVGVGVSMDSWIFREQLQGSKPIGLKRSLSLKSFLNVDVWNRLAWPIWTPKIQGMAKRRVRNRIGNITPDH